MRNIFIILLLIGIFSFGATARTGGGITSKGATTYTGWTRVAPYVYTKNGTDNVGIGTTIVPQKLYVSGTGEFQAFKLNQNPSAGYVLTSTALGIGTWMPSSGGGGGSPPGGNIGAVQYNNPSGTFAGDATKFSFNGTNVGIGTSTAPASSLTILGNVGIGTLAGDGFLINSPPSGGMTMYGNVGIGTWIPTTRLALSASLNDTGIDINSTASSFTSANIVAIGGGGGSGGGSGGVNYPAAGGGGEVKISNAFTITNLQSIGVTVGGGGAGQYNAVGADGTSSVFSSITARGGKAGGTVADGRGGNSGNTLFTGGVKGTVASGGGAGDSQNGTNGVADTNGGNGGAGTSSSISGASVCYAGGGAGLSSGALGTATCGGGVDANGSANTGGGAGISSGVLRNGGTGVVIISYITPTPDDGTGGTISHAGGNTIHTFTASGTFVAPSNGSSVTASPRIKFQQTLATKYTVGIDGNDFSKFKLSTTALGTGDVLAVDSAGNVGINGSSPAGKFEVNAAGTPFLVDSNSNVGIGTNIIGNAGLSVMNGNVGIGTWKPVNEFVVKGIYAHSWGSPIPVLSSCGGGSPTVKGTDNDFQITVGTTATGCTATFGRTTYADASCVVSNQTMSITSALGYTVSSTAIVISQGVGLSGDLLNVHCDFKNP